MGLLQLAQEASVIFQQLEPGLTAAVKTGTAVGTLGSTSIKVVQKGKTLVTYWISRLVKKDAHTEKDEAVLPANVEKITDMAAIATKEDVAILIDINRRMLVDVARYLDEKQIDADLIIVTNDPTYSNKVQFLDPANSKQWTEVVKEFSVAMNAVQRAVGGVRLHIFLSAPLALAFGAGSVWGTVNEATVYHWEKGSYYPSMYVSRELR